VTQTTSPQSTAEIVVDGITEQTIRFESVGSGTVAMEVGDGATFYNNIYDAADNIIGGTVGLMVAATRRPSDGHLITEYTEVIQLPGGTLRSNGQVDRLAMFGGLPIRLDVVGTSGSFEGRTGVRECQLLPPFPPTVQSRVSVRITLDAVA
jgi:hypothetical protein